MLQAQTNSLQDQLAAMVIEHADFRSKFDILQAFYDQHTHGSFGRPRL
jgi:hypothetical protein